MTESIEIIDTIEEQIIEKINIKTKRTNFKSSQGETRSRKMVT